MNAVPVAPLGAALTALVVDPKASFRHYLARLLRRHGVRCLEASTPERAAALLERGGLVDMVLLCAGDGRPGASGSLARVVAAGATTPVVVLEHETNGDSAPLRAAGARAVMSWPELLADPQTQLSRLLGQPLTAMRARHGPLAIEDLQHRLRWRGRTLRFAATDLAIVQLLAAHPGQDISFGRLAAESGLAPEGLDNEQIRQDVRAAVKRIRRKFRRIDPKFDAIRSYPGFGYRWLDDLDDSC
jgi:two-component system response regulator ChvI